MITNISEIKGVRIYKCYSQRLSHAIQTQLQVLPVNVYWERNGRIVNAYILTDELSLFLKKWSEARTKKGGKKDE